jgi:hypothetical protein
MVSYVKEVEMARQAQTLPIVEHEHKELTLANGPFHVATTGGLVVITFTQVRSRVESMTVGAGKASYEAVVVTRVALAPQDAKALGRIIGNLGVLKGPAAGSA